MEDRHILAILLSSICSARIAFHPVARADIILNTFSPTTYSSNAAAMDAALGIAGFDIESFGDTTLLPKLSYTLDDPAAGPFTSLPALRLDGTFPGATAWDDPYVLLSHPANSLAEAGRANQITFIIDGGTSSLGVGLSSFQSLSSPQYPITDHELFVNGTSLGRLEDATGWVSGLDRNLYLRIDATAGDLINSVSFKNNTTGDLLVFDHVAIASVPEPQSLICLLGVLRMTCLRRRSREGHES